MNILNTRCRTFTNAVAVIMPDVFTLVPDPNAVLIPVKFAPLIAGNVPVKFAAGNEVKFVPLPVKDVAVTIPPVILPLPKSIPEECIVVPDPI